MFYVDMIAFLAAGLVFSSHGMNIASPVRELFGRYWIFCFPAEE